MTNSFTGQSLEVTVDLEHVFDEYVAAASSERIEESVTTVDGKYGSNHRDQLKDCRTAALDQVCDSALRQGSVRVGLFLAQKYEDITVQDSSIPVAYEREAEKAIARIKELEEKGAYDGWKKRESVFDDSRGFIDLAKYFEDQPDAAVANSLLETCVNMECARNSQRGDIVTNALSFSNVTGAVLSAEMKEMIIERRFSEEFIGLYNPTTFLREIEQLDYKPSREFIVDTVISIVSRDHTGNNVKQKTKDWKVMLFDKFGDLLPEDFVQETYLFWVKELFIPDVCEPFDQQDFNDKEYLGHSHYDTNIADYPAAIPLERAFYEIIEKTGIKPSPETVSKAVEIIEEKEVSGEEEDQFLNSKAYLNSLFN
jgi:hypothetical protein